MSPTSPQRITRVLVVEDDEGQLRTLTAILEDEGFSVTGVNSAGYALELVGSGDFGVAVIDMRLPDLTGTELLEQIKAIDSGVRLIVHTGYGSFDSAKAAVNLGAFAYVEKMDHPETLLRCVHHAFRDRLSRYADELERAVAQRTAALRRSLADLKALQEELLHAQKMDAVGQLADGIAHDFNNLLTVILGNTAMVRDRLTDDCELSDLLGLVEHAAEQAAGLTRSLLTFSRKLPARLEPVDLGRVAEESVAMLRRMLPSHVELELDTPGDDPAVVRADRVQLQQVLLNLVINARDAMTEPGTLRISVGSADHVPAAQIADEPNGVPGPMAGWVCLAVSDTGKGIAPDVQPRIFEPFFTTKSRGRGTGLGLAIVHGIVTGHEGHIEVDSAPGRGTTFRVLLPGCRAPVGPAEAPECEPELECHGRLVLLAEDNELVRGVTASMLRSLGYDVVAVEDGQLLLDAFQTSLGVIDLLVVDVELPKLDGLSCLRKLRSTESGIPAIVITGNTGQRLPADLQDHALLLAKPFARPDLARAITELSQKGLAAGHPS